MPFKTKRKKLHAIKRRVAISKQGLATYNIGYTFEDKKENASKDERQQVAKNIREQEVDSTKNYSYVSSELAKTLLLALGIIGLQLAIKFGRATL